MIVNSGLLDGALTYGVREKGGGGARGAAGPQPEIIDFSAQTLMIRENIT